MDTIVLGKKGYQSPHAYITVDKPTITPFEKFTIKGYKFTAFLKRGNPAVSILIDGKPLTGAKLTSAGKFKVTLVMPPFEPGNHIIDVFGIQTNITVESDDEVITQADLRKLVERDFIVKADCHLLFSDERYRVCPLSILKCYLGKTDVSRKKYVAEWFDCLTPDTSVVVKSGDVVDLKEVASIHAGDYVLDHNNEWTLVNWIKPKVSVKPLIQLVDKNGVIELTEDHKVRVNGKYTEIGNTDKTSEFDTISYTHFLEQPIDNALAFLYGLFCADGHSSAKFSHWNIHNQKLPLLDAAKKTISTQYPNINFGIKLYDCFKAGTVKNLGVLQHDLFMLKVVNSEYGVIRNSIAAHFDNMFYTSSGKKKIPACILNSDKETRLSFLEGYMAGDGHDNYAQTDSKCLATGLAIISRDIPHSLRTYNKSHIYSFHQLTHKSWAPGVCYTIKDGKHVVYDINCDAHEFCAGPFKIKNCDDFSDSLHGQFTFDTYPKGYAHGELWVETGNGGGHAINCFCIKDADKIKMVVVEPQSSKILNEWPKTWKAFMIKI